METIRGNIKSLKLAAVSNGETSTGCLAAFKLDGLSVQVGCKNSIHFQENDEIVLAGKKKKSGVFDVRAYNNKTSGVSSVIWHWGDAFILLSVVLTFILVLVLLNAPVAVNRLSIPIYLASLFFCIYKNKKTRDKTKSSISN